MLAAELARVSAFYSERWCALARARTLPCASRSVQLFGATFLTHAAAARSDKLSAQLDDLERTVRPAPADGASGGAGELGGSGASAPPAASPAALAAAQRALVSDLVPQLGALRLFVVLNYTAVVKARRAARRSANAHTPRRRLPSPRTWVQHWCTC
jgi:hypothetical protein